MIESLFQSTTIPLLEQVATFTERRQEVLAGNIANINTDDYRMRDLDVNKFQAALRTAVERLHQPRQTQSAYPSYPFASPGVSPPAAGGSGPKDLSEIFTPKLFEAIEAPPENLTFQDGNNRSIEQQIMEVTKNAMLQSYAVQIINSQMSLLEHVITERV